MHTTETSTNKNNKQYNHTCRSWTSSYRQFLHQQLSFLHLCIATTQGTGKQICISVAEQIASCLELMCQSSGGDNIWRKDKYLGSTANTDMSCTALPERNKHQRLIMMALLFFFSPAGARTFLLAHKSVLEIQTPFKKRGERGSQQQNNCF